MSTEVTAFEDRIWCSEENNKVFCIHRDSNAARRMIVINQYVSNKILKSAIINLIALGTLCYLEC